jgi:hypothetical protein
MCAELWEFCSHCKKHFKTMADFNRHFEQDWVLEDWEATEDVVKYGYND